MNSTLFKDVVTVFNEDNQIADIHMYVTGSTFQSVFKLVDFCTCRINCINHCNHNSDLAKLESSEEKSGGITEV